MADTKISGLPAAASVDGSELIPVVKLGTTQRVTPAQIKTYMGVSGVNTGDQDLSALALKATTVNGQPLSANVVITKSDVGLGNAENTSDADKPVSTATSTALSGKQSTLVSGTNIKTINGNTLLGSGDLVVSGSGTVTSASVVSANGFAGTVATATTTPAITLTTSVMGLLKGNGTAIAAAVAGTDIKTINSASLIGSGDVVVGTVTAASVATANGFKGTVSTPSTTPAITIGTSVTGLLKGDGTGVSAATLGTDYINAGSNTFTGAQVYSDQQVSRGMTKDMGMVFLNKGNSSTTAQTIDYSAAAHQKLTVTGAFVMNAVTNWPPSGNTGELLLELVNGASSAITWTMGGTTQKWWKSDGTSVATYALSGVTFQTTGTNWILMWSTDAGTTTNFKVMT